MYILSNGVKITEKMHQRLCQAIKDASKRYFYFLDIETGKLIRVFRTNRQKIAVAQGEPKRFIPLPEVTENERRKRFVFFVEELGVIDVPKLRKRLSKEIKKGFSIDELEQILKNDPSGWIHGWVQDEQFLLAEKIEEWITEPPLSAKDDPDYWYDDDCSLCQLLRKAEEEGKTPTIKETKEAFLKVKEKGAFVGGSFLKTDEERKYIEEQGFEHIGKTDNLKMPKWVECTWRRVPCGKDDCPICGRIKKDRQRHIEKGEDPDDLKNVFEDAGRNLKEALEMIKKDAEGMNIDIINIKDIKEPPEPEEFPLYQASREWGKEISKIRDEAELSGNWWIYTEEAADLFWYANTLMAKTYRQLCNRWHIKNGDDYGDFDYQYTGYVLKECLKILKRSLKELIDSNYFQKKKLESIYSNLLNLEKQIIKI